MQLYRNISCCTLLDFISKGFHPFCSLSPSQWGRTTNNRDVSTGPLARLFAHLLAPLTRLLIPDCLLCSRPLLRSLVCLLAHFAHSLAPGKVNYWCLKMTWICPTVHSHEYLLLLNGIMMSLITICRESRPYAPLVVNKGVKIIGHRPMVKGNI